MLAIEILILAVGILITLKSYLPDIIENIKEIRKGKQNKQLL